MNRDGIGYWQTIWRVGPGGWLVGQTIWVPCSIYQAYRP